MGTALITGASAGLGHDFARIFANEGHSTSLDARRKDLLEKVADELRGINSNIRVDVIEADLGVPGAGSELFAKIKTAGLSVDYLVNNAGFGSSGEFSALDMQRQLQMIDLNVRALVELTHLCLPEMIERKSGRILNVGSTAGFQPGPYMAVYYATKAFVNSFSEALHEELKATGVTCTVLAPGATRTEFAEVAHMETSALFKSGNVATSEAVAKYGYEAMMKGTAMVIQGVSNQLLLQSLRVSPRFAIRKIVAKLNRTQAAEQKH